MEHVIARREFPAPLALPERVEANNAVCLRRRPRGRGLRLGLGPGSSEAELGESLEMFGREPRWGMGGLGAAAVESASGEEGEENGGGEAKEEEEEGGYKGHHQGHDD